MKKQRFFLIGLIISGLLFSLVISCGTSTEDLAKQVQESYVSEWKEHDLPISITKDLVLIKKSKTEYIGLMTVSAYGESERVTVSVIFDGKSFTSEIEDW
jgi:hypothetical protein